MAQQERDDVPFLEDTEFDRRAVAIMRQLDGLRVGQALAILDKARGFTLTASVAGGATLPGEDDNRPPFWERHRPPFGSDDDATDP